MTCRLVFAIALIVCSTGRTASAVGAFPFTIEFSGTDFFLLVDGNNDGPSPGDCRYKVLLNKANPFDFPAMKIEAVHDAASTDSPPLNLCTGEYIGDLLLGADDSSDWAEADLDTTTMSPGTTGNPTEPLGGLRYYPPMELELFEEFGGPPDGFPIAFTDALVEGPDEEVLFAMRPCNQGGPLLQISGPAGVQVLVELEEYGPPGDPTHLKMSGLPFETASLGTLVTRDAYFPVENRALTAKVEGTELIDLPIDELGACGRTMAPVASHWMLGALLLGLLGLGTAALGRWGVFYRGLPRP